MNQKKENGKNYCSLLVAYSPPRFSCRMVADESFHYTDEAERQGRVETILANYPEGSDPEVLKTDPDSTDKDLN
jgi:hypothetical protein